MNASVSAFIGAGMLAKLQYAGEHCAKNQDRFFLVRQLEYFRVQYQGCRCKGHGCGGCTVLAEMGLALNEVVAAQVQAEPEKCEHERDKARELRAQERRALSEDVKRTWNNARRMKLSSAERKREDEEQSREEPRPPKPRQMGIDDDRE